MRLSIVRDGRTEEVEVDLEGKTVRIGGRSYPFVLVKAGPIKVELEIAGEKVVVDGWPTGMAEPPGPVDVNGERGALTEVHREASSADRARTPSPTTPSVPVPASTAGPGVAIVPPMPGKVIEVRVAEGEKVTKGQVLVVVEAMKMRNEVASPITGRVTGLAVQPGTNVRAREAMLRVVDG